MIILTVLMINATITNTLIIIIINATMANRTIIITIQMAKLLKQKITKTTK